MKASRLLVVAGALLLVSACFSCSMSNVAYTAPQAADEFKPRIYNADMLTVRQHARMIVGEFERWTLVSEKVCCFPGEGEEVSLAAEDQWKAWEHGAPVPDLGRFDVEVRSAVWKFVDDLKIYFAPEPGDRTRVELYSASRVGKEDFGANADHIRKFLNKLDRRIETFEKVTIIREGKPGAATDEGN